MLNSILEESTPSSTSLLYVSIYKPFLEKNPIGRILLQKIPSDPDAPRRFDGGVARSGGSGTLNPGHRSDNPASQHVISKVPRCSSPELWPAGSCTTPLRNFFFFQTLACRFLHSTPDLIIIVYFSCMTDSSLRACTNPPPQPT